MREKILDLIRRVERDLKELKQYYRDPAHQPPSLSVYVHLRRDKEKATLLYSAVASSRGKLHRKSWTLEEQKAYVEERLPDLLELAAA